MGRSVTVEAIVLRSVRSGEADRVLHLLARDRGRLGVIAKGARRVGSRWGARLEPLSRIQAVVHQGRGELSPLGSVHLVRSGQAIRDEPYRLGVALVAVELVTRLFPDAPEAPERVFDGLDRLLEVAEAVAPGRGDPTLDPLALAFGLKMLAVAGWQPELAACAACGGPGPLVGHDPAAGGATCAACARGRRLDPASAPTGIGLLRSPLAAASFPVAPDVARDLRDIVGDSVRYHAGAALRTLGG